MLDELRSSESATHVTLRQLRRASGIVMLTYLFLHLVNHSLGNVSLDLAEFGLTFAKSIWRSLPGTLLLYSAAAVHVALALRTIFTRRHWALPPIEWLRLFAGLSLPTILIEHAVNTRLGSSLYDYDANYRNVISTILSSGTKGWQFALLAPGWLHGCLGIWITLRQYAWAQRLKPLLIAFVAIMPLLSALGFARMSEELALDPSGGYAYYAPQGDSGAVLKANLRTWRLDILGVYLALVATAFVSGQAYRRYEARARDTSA
jgi:adenylate cyclase